MFGSLRGYRDEDFEPLGYVDASGIEHESYEAACDYYGADTPAQLQAEAKAEAREWEEWTLSFGSGPLGSSEFGLFFTDLHELLDDEIPF